MLKEVKTAHIHKMSWLAKSDKRGYMTSMPFSNKIIAGLKQKHSINYKYFNYHWSTWILSLIQVWSDDLNEMTNQILHLLHIWITPPHQIMLTLIYQSSRANVNFPKIPCFLKEGMRCLWKWGSRSHSTKNPHFLQRKENLIFPSFHAKRLFHGDLCFQKYYIPLYVCTNEQFINSKHL